MRRLPDSCRRECPFHSMMTGTRLSPSTHRPILSVLRSIPIRRNGAYALAAEYRRRGVPVVLGGFHPTLAPDEALGHADSIVYRAFDFRTHARNHYFLFFFLFSNLRLRRGRRWEEEDALPSRLLRQSDRGPVPYRIHFSNQDDRDPLSEQSGSTG
ncbi:MAG: hypothetical protein JW863_20800 [Chitinispirillaceae bacterium]|nr:hypothetical protein [Chitinispirillaceae bacterium]